MAGKVKMNMKVLRAQSRVRPFEVVRVKCPDHICLYRTEYYDKTLEFFDAFERLVLIEGRYVELDFSDLRELTAAASLVLFAKITRCQCCILITAFRYSNFVVTFLPPLNKDVKSVMVKSGLWAAIGPGGQPKLDKLWEDWRSPYKTSNDPSGHMSEAVGHLLKQSAGALPSKIVAAIQEGYLNVAHHAYEAYKTPESPLHPFMVNRFWQYSRMDHKTGKLSIVIYDTGSGIPDTIRCDGEDSDAIIYAMQSGVTRFRVRGRGRGFNDIKSPIDRNATAEYLLVYSGRGLVIYKKGVSPVATEHKHVIGGTLLEWTFAGIGK